VGEPTFTEARLVYRHRPDEDLRPPNALQQPFEPGAGHYDIGVVIEGAFVPLITKKAGNVRKRIERAKAAAQSRDDGDGSASPAQG